MSEIEIKNGSFIISGRPQIIHAAEFHYFRTPENQWESRLKLLKETGFNTVATYIPWLWHEIEEGQFDFDGHSHPMRNLSGFLDLAAQLGLWIIARPGPYIMAETINEGIPKWVFSSYPELSIIDQKGDHLHYLSYLHPQADKLIKAWYKAVFKILNPRQIDHAGKIIMIQLDNEIGMIAWVKNMIDLNPDNLERFTEYLKVTKKRDHSTVWVSEELCHPDQENGRYILQAYSHYYREVISIYAQRPFYRSSIFMVLVIKAAVFQSGYRNC
ncbi:MAG: beta-galactosidase [Erysipelotrichaceae bacterium]|nr:MAG: beta-galactosidase [Erysipelotrichaceae bacterium]